MPNKKGTKKEEKKEIKKEIKKDKVKEEVKPVETKKEVIEKESEAKPKKTNTALIVIVCIVIAIALIGGVIAYLIYNSPKTVYTNALNDVKNELNTIINLPQEKKKDGSGDYEFSISAELPSMYKDIEDLINDLNFSGSYINNGEKSMVSLTGDYNDKNIANIDFYSNDKKYYFDLNEIYSKVITYELTDNKEFNIDDISTVLTHGIDAVNSSIKNEYISKEADTITINNEDVNVTKNVLYLDSNELKEFTESIINILENDNKFIEALSNLNNETKEETKKSLEEAKENTFEDESFEMIIYTNGGNTNIARIEITTYSNESDMTYTITQESKGKYSYSIANATITVKGKYETETDGNKEITLFTLDVPNTGISIRLDIAVTKDETTKEITLPDDSNTIEIGALEEKDSNEIMNNLITRPGFAEAVQKLGTIIESFSTSV